jgi:hypothetical protein
MLDDARQWMQLRLHRPVTSQAIHFGMKVPVSIDIPVPYKISCSGEIRFSIGHKRPFFIYR